MILKPLKHYCFVMFVLLSALVQPAFGSDTKCSETKIVFVGDSLFAGYGLQPGQSYPDRVSAMLKDVGVEPLIVNAGVSGDTTTGGLSRLEWSIGDDTAAVVLELGANDALRGIPVNKTDENLRKMISTLQERSISVLLMGMRAPPNMGEKYSEAFDSVFPALTRDFDIHSYPFFLDGVAGEPSLNQADGIHPNQQGVEMIVERSKPAILQFVRQLCN